MFTLRFDEYRQMFVVKDTTGAELVAGDLTWCGRALSVRSHKHCGGIFRLNSNGSDIPDLGIEWDDRAMREIRKRR